jgi:hypothetical protein
MGVVKYLTEKEFNAVLPKEVAEKFEIKKMEKRTSTKFHHPKFGLVDLSKLSIAKAEYLVSQKADFIELKKKA